MNSIENEVYSLQMDDLVWYIYIFIAVAALYSNKLECEFKKNKDKKKLTEYHSINLVVLTIAFVIYIQFVLRAFKSYGKNPNTNTLINVIASILFLSAGGLFLYLELVTTDSEINEVGI